MKQKNKKTSTHKRHESVSMFYRRKCSQVVNTVREKRALRIYCTSEREIGEVKKT